MTSADLLASFRVVPHGQGLPSVALLCLLLARLAPLVLAFGLLVLRHGLGLAQLALATTFALVLLPIALAMTSQAAPAAAHVTTFDAAFFAQLAVELVRGTLFGWALALPFAAFSWTGAFADRLRAADGSNAHAGTEPDGPLEALSRFAALALCFASGTHRLLIDALLESLRAQPIGVFPAGNALVGAFPAGNTLGPALLASAALVGHALALSVTLLAPVLLCTLLAAVTVVVIERAAAFVVPPIASAAWPLFVLSVFGLALPQTLAALPEAVRSFMGQAASVLRMLG